MQQILILSFSVIGLTEVTLLSAIGTRQTDMDQLVRPLQSNAKPLDFVYETGPWGSYISRSNETSPWWLGRRPLNILKRRASR